MQSRRFDNIGETLYSAELSNGLQLRVIPKRDFAASYAVFAANYGGAHRRFRLDGQWIDTPAGVAHYLEHKMFDLPGGDNAMELLSANGADPNAFTSAGRTAYFFQSTDHFEENLRLLLHFVSTPYFTEETVQKEQGIIAQEIRMGEDDPDARHYYELMRMLYTRHPIRDQVAGTVESIAEITADTLYACHRAFYAPSNMTLCVEGDVAPERVLSIAEEVLCREKAPVPRVDLGEEEGLLPSESFRTLTMPVSAPQLLAGAKFRPAAGGEAQLRQRLAGSLALRVLLGYSSAFYTGLYAEGLLNRSYSYDSEIIAGTGTVILGGESPEPQKVLEALSRAVEGLRQNGLDTESFRRAKRASLGARLRGLEDFESLCLATATGVFEGYCALDAIRLLDQISQAECEAFLLETLAPERLAAVVMQGGKE